MKSILPILADIANGIFATFIAGYITDTELLWYYFPIGILFAMIPDLDAIPELFSTGKISALDEKYGDHREFFHYPLLFILLGIVILYLKPFFGYLFLSGVVLHFANDMYGTGWGVSLFWPVTKTRFKFLKRKANQMKKTLIKNNQWEMLEHDDRKLRLVTTWNKNELHEYIKRFGFNDWIDEYYLTFNWTTAIEYALFGLSVLLLLTHFEIF